MSILVPARHSGLKVGLRRGISYSQPQRSHVGLPSAGLVTGGTPAHTKIHHQTSISFSTATQSSRNECQNLFPGDPLRLPTNGAHFTSIYTRRAPISGRVQYISDAIKLSDQPDLDFCDYLKCSKKMVLQNNDPIMLAIGKIMTTVTQVHLARKHPRVSGRPPQVYVESGKSNAHVAHLSEARVMVSTALLLECQTSAQIASVLAHELGHVVCDHAFESMTESMFGRYLHNCDIGYKDAFELSRIQEFEADFAGLMLMSTAGFDPNCQLDAMEIRAAYETIYATDYILEEKYRTYPIWKNRLSAIIKHLPEAEAVYHAAETYSLGQFMDMQELHSLVGKAMGKCPVRGFRVWKTMPVRQVCAAE